MKNINPATELFNVTEVQSEAFGLVCRYVAPSGECYYNTLYYVAIRFHRRVWYRALSLRCVCIRHSGIIPTPYDTFVPNFVSVAASIADLAHGEKSRTQSIIQ